MGAVTCAMALQEQLAERRINRNIADNIIDGDDTFRGGVDIVVVSTTSVTIACLTCRVAPHWMPVALVERASHPDGRYSHLSLTL